MRLDKLELYNICQHDHLEWEFGRGLIGIYGPNGSGKSNSMNVACYAGLTNDYSRHEGGKLGLIRQQAGEEKSQIRVVFSHDGEQFEISRGLQRATAHRMARPGKAELTKATDIQKELEEVLGINRRLIDSYIFVEQWQLFAFLSDTAAERAKSFAQLCNTVHAEKCWDALKEQITADLPMTGEIQDNSDELRGKMGENKKRKKEFEAKQKEARDSLLSKAKKAKYEATVKLRARYEYANELCKELAPRVEELMVKAKMAKKVMATSKKARDDSAQAYEGDDERKEEIAAELATLRSSSDRYERKVMHGEAVKKCNRELVKLEKEAPVDPEFDVGNLQVSISELTVSVGKHRDLINSFDGDVAECPTCGTSALRLEDKLLEARSDLPVQQNMLAVQKKRLLRQFDYRTEFTLWRHRGDQLRERLDGARELYGEMEDAQPVAADRYAELKNERQNIMLRKTALDECDKGFISDNKCFEAAKSRHQERKKLYAEHQETARASYVASDETDRSVNKLATHRQANIDLAATKATLAEIAEALAGSQWELDRLKATIARSKKAKKWVAALQDVRDEVMHRDKLAQIVHKNYLFNMEDEINRTLSDFESPFSVKATEDVGFIAHFASGTQMPAGGLSGGQKVMLALAYRLTVNSLFASQVGMMVLDEPTDGLDADNRALAAGVFQRLGDVARSRGHQVIVITHDESLARVFDQKFMLERPL